MKKIVVVCSSPRRHGNSEILVDQFIKGAQEAGNEVEKIILNDYTIKSCIACEYCRHHDNQCIHKDQANEVIEKIIQSDIFVLATPIYFGSLSAQLKILIDRFFAREYEIRESIKRKKAYLILTSGTKNIEDTVGTVESFRGFIKVLRTVDEGGIIYGLGAFKKGDAFKHQTYFEAYKYGKDIQ